MHILFANFLPNPDNPVVQTFCSVYAGHESLLFCAISKRGICGGVWVKPRPSPKPEITGRVVWAILREWIFAKCQKQGANDAGIRLPWLWPI